MKKLIYGILFVGILVTPVMAMQNNSNGLRRGQKFVVPGLGRVEFVLDAGLNERPANVSGRLEWVLGYGWVRVLQTQTQNNQNDSSSLTDTLTDGVLSRFMAFSSAWIIAWLKKEAVEERVEGYVELSPIVIELLSNGVWENIKKLPGKLLTLGLDNSWKNEEKDLIKAATNLFTSKFSDKYEDETVDSIEEFVKNLGIEGLYIDPLRVSKILHDAAGSWDTAAGITRGITRTQSRQRYVQNNSGVSVTSGERRQIREILGIQTSNSQIERNIKQGFITAKNSRNNPFAGNFGQYLFDILDGAKEVGMENDIAGYVSMVYR